MATPVSYTIERGSERSAVTLEARFRRSVADHISLSGISASEFGLHAVGSSGLLSRLNAGQSVTLDTADRVLDFMGETQIGPAFRREIEAFIEVTGIAETTFGIEAAGNSAFVRRLRDGASPRLATVDRVQTWMRTVATRVERIAIARILGDGEKARPIGARSRAARSKRHTVARRWGSDREAARRDDPAAYNRQVFLSTREAAAFLNTSPRMLNRYRTNGEGPAYCKSGQRVLYARADLLAWAWTRRHGTAESD